MLAKTNIQNTVESELMKEEVIMHHQEGNRIQFIIFRMTHHHDEYSNIYLTDKKAQEIENYIYKEKESNNFGPPVPREFNGKYILKHHNIPCNFLNITTISNVSKKLCAIIKLQYLIRLKIVFYNCAKITGTILTHIGPTKEYLSASE